jgi:Cd2+/Zn2+-exporting ATPase
MTIILLACAFAIFLPFVLSMTYFGIEGSIYRALAFLIAASPCALVIAIPIGYLSAISSCARRGILLKGGITLDALASCKTIAFDKTGTLTTGELACVGIIPLSGQSQEEVNLSLSIALALERNAMHPIARAIIKYTQERGIAPSPLSQYTSIPGYGLEGTTIFQGETVRVYIGRPSYIQSKMTKESQAVMDAHRQDCESQGKLLAILQIGDSSILLEFQDTTRPKIKELITAIKNKYKLRILMLTGDHGPSAKMIADHLGIDEFFANLRPEDKLRHVTELSQQTHLAMIGDGINDAPSLARATVGISMGKVGSATAIDASDVVLLHDNLEFLDWLIAKSHSTQRIIKQNVVIASAAILFATTPALLGWVPLWLAVILHEGGTVLVGLNSLRLLKK